MYIKINIIANTPFVGVSISLDNESAQSYWQAIILTNNNPVHQNV